MLTSYILFHIIADIRLTGRTCQTPAVFQRSNTHHSLFFFLVDRLSCLSHVILCADFCRAVRQ